MYIIVIIYYFILIYSKLFLDKAFSDDYYESDTEKHFDKLAFSITFSEEEWELIKPRPKLYNDKKYSRTYLVLSPYEWSNIVQEHFFLHSRLPCSISFKKAKVQDSGNIICEHTWLMLKLWFNF